MLKTDSFLKTSSLIVFCMIITKISGFIREMVQAYFYGTTAISDAYIIATTIPAILFAGITGSILTAYIPRYFYLKNKKANINFITNNIINILCSLVFICSIIVAIYPVSLVEFVARGLDNQTLNYSIVMVQIIIPFSVFYAFQNLADGYLQSNHIFWMLSIASLLTNIVNIIVLAIAGNNVHLLAIGYSVSMILPAIVTFVVAKRIGFKYEASFDLKNEETNIIIKLALPVFLGQFFLQANVIVERNFASMLGVGVISAMKYANQLNLLIVSMFIMSVGAVLLPKFSATVTEDLLDFKRLLVKVLNKLIVLVVPFIILLAVLATPLVEVVFMRGAFDGEAVKTTAKVLSIYSLSAFGLIFSDVLSRAFYALGDTRTPTVATCCSALLNIFLSFIFVPYWDYMGLAYSTSITANVLLIVLFICLKKKIGQLDINLLRITLVKIIIIGILMGFFIQFYYTNFSISLNFADKVIKLLSVVLFSIFFYVVNIVFMKVDGYEIIVKFSKNTGDYCGNKLKAIFKK